MTKSLDERAMEYAIIAVGVSADRIEDMFDLRPSIPLDEWRADELKHQMFRDFDIYDVTQAIKRAEEIVRMVITDQPSDQN